MAKDSKKISFLNAARATCGLVSVAIRCVTPMLRTAARTHGVAGLGPKLGFFRSSKARNLQPSPPGIINRKCVQSGAMPVARTTKTLATLFIHARLLHGTWLLIQRPIVIISSRQRAAVRPSVKRKHQPAGYGGAGSDTVEPARGVTGLPGRC